MQYMQYIENPAVIDALQWDGTLAGMQAIKQQFPELTSKQEIVDEEEETVVWAINETGTSYYLVENDYVIRSADGQFSAMKPDEFALAYVPAS